MKRWIVLPLLIVGVGSTAARAEVGCHDAEVLSMKLIDDICWDCVFPLRLAGQKISSGPDDPPKTSHDEPVCACNDINGVPQPGVTTGFWEPFSLIETQRTAGCSSVLGGTMFPFGDRLSSGYHARGGKPGAQETFVHYHYYVFPVLQMLDLFVNRYCKGDGVADIDPVHFSEIDPAWNNDEIAFFSFPEAILASNPLVPPACSADAAGANIGKPTSMFACYGSWGTAYPNTGNQYTTSDMLTVQSLAQAKALATMHRRGWVKRTWGDTAMCGPDVAFTLEKDAYKITTFYPIPETSDAHRIGESVYKWGLGKMIPATGEDFVFINWRWTDCCNVQ